MSKSSSCFLKLAPLSAAILAPLVMTLAALVTIAPAKTAHADEKVGTFSLDNIVLRPTYLSQEGQGGRFSLEDSQIGLSWRKDRHWSAHFDLGDTSYRNLPIYYGQNSPMYTGQNTAQFGLVDGYAEYDGVYGRVRAGLLPVDFGYEGTLDPAHRYFFYSQSIANRLVALDDEGVSFYTEHEGFFTELVLHNGSGDQSNSGNVWVTGNWGYAYMQNFKWEMSLQTGYIPGSATTNTQNVTVADFQPGVMARVRNGVMYVEYSPVYWDAIAEIGGGELVQDSKTSRYDYQLAQVTHNFTRNLSAGMRYDFYNPNMGMSGLGQTEMTALLMLKSDDGTSDLLFEGTKHFYETNQIHDDQLRVVWLLTPFAR